MPQKLLINSVCLFLQVVGRMSYNAVIALVAEYD